MYQQHELSISLVFLTNTTVKQTRKNKQLLKKLWYKPVNNYSALIIQLSLENIKLAVVSTPSNVGFHLSSSTKTATGNS